MPDAEERPGCVGFSGWQFGVEETVQVPEGVPDGLSGETCVEGKRPLHTFGLRIPGLECLEVGEISSFGPIHNRQNLSGGQVFAGKHGKTVDGLDGEQTR